MWIWLLSNIAGCVVGDAVAKWFEKTALGRWFYKKLDSIFAGSISCRLVADHIF